MSLLRGPHSRRGFLQRASLGAAGVAFGGSLSGRGLEARFGNDPSYDANGLIRLDSNENPFGPPAEAIDAIMQMFGEAGRYPKDTDLALRAAIAEHHGVKPEQVLIGSGSTEILKLATEALTSAQRHLVTASPTFETPTTTAQRLGIPIKAPRVTSSLQLDLDAMLAAAPGAGLVFVCNPNNPTGTMHPSAAIADFVARVRRAAPDAHILLDEAYFHFVNDPSYVTAIPMALADPKVIVARTLSKIYGLAGVRAGYAIAHADTIAKLTPYRLQNSVSVLASAAGVASLRTSGHVERQRELNTAAREYASTAFKKRGFTVFPSQANFFMVDIKRDAKAFRDLCRDKGVAIGRPFPPLDQYARISVGTMEEMQRALPLLFDALA